MVFPQFSGIQAQQQPTRSVELLRKSVDWLIFLTIPISVLYLLFGKELVLVFSGPAFTNSISSVYWMAPIPLFISLSNLLLYYGLSSRPELQKRIAVGVAVGILISIGLNSWLIPLYGAKGAAMNSFLTELGFLIFFLLLFVLMMLELLELMILFVLQLHYVLLLKLQEYLNLFQYLH